MTTWLDICTSIAVTHDSQLKETTVGAAIAIPQLEGVAAIAFEEYEAPYTAISGNMIANKPAKDTILIYDDLFLMLYFND